MVKCQKEQRMYSKTVRYIPLRAPTLRFLLLTSRMFYVYISLYRYVHTIPYVKNMQIYIQILCSLPFFFQLIDYIDLLCLFKIYTVFYCMGVS